MKRLIVVVSFFVMQVATDVSAANVYIFDSSGAIQKVERFFLSPSACSIDTVNLTPIGPGEFTKFHTNGKKLKYTVLCKIGRALDAEKEIDTGNGDVYLDLQISRYKKSMLKQVDTLPEGFYQNYKEAK